eukprot:TRINITY_DN76746_c0_g1_i1.p1 TRINITY_DN76746_c0_g1~~TRINITY_DN76746_c0_g1_i1.p1  ORF type:complete len:434 (-),score=109.58 TRINITY_DN76746_c0_g1_i1:85-1386(-)
MFIKKGGDSPGGSLGHASTASSENTTPQAKQMKSLHAALSGTPGLLGRTGSGAGAMMRQSFSKPALGLQDSGLGARPLPYNSWGLASGLDGSSSSGLFEAGCFGSLPGETSSFTLGGSSASSSQAILGAITKGGSSFRAAGGKTFATGGALSQAACRENNKTQRCNKLIESSELPTQARSSGQVSPHASALEPSAQSAMEEDVEAHARAFREGARVVDELIEGLTSQRLDHLANRADARRLGELEEERRQRELEMKRARRKEREARNPAKKVALKLENRRRYGAVDESGVAQDVSIPTCKVEFVSSKGFERVNLVDVGQLQARSVVSQGATVRSLLDSQKQRELQRREAERATAGDGSPGMMVSAGRWTADRAARGMDFHKGNADDLALWLEATASSMSAGQQPCQRGMAKPGSRSGARGFGRNMSAPMLMKA